MTLVQFQFPVPITRDEAQEIFLEVAPKFREIPGLIRKYFLLYQIRLINHNIIGADTKREFPDAKAN